MTDAAAAFRASYSDWKLIKTRSVIQIVLEVPIEQADRAYQVLGGMPTPGAETWCAIARLYEGAASGDVQAGNEGSIPSRSTNSRLNAGVTVAPDLPVEAAGPVTSSPCGEQDRPVTPRKPVAADKRMAQRAGILCSDFLFWRFLSDNYPDHFVADENEAADLVRIICAVRSRSEISPNTEAGEKWTDLHGRFLAWKMVPA